MLSSDTWLGARGGAFFFFYGGVFESLKKKRKKERSDRDTAREGGKVRKREERKSQLQICGAGEQSPCLLSSFNTAYSLTLFLFHTSFFPVFPIIPLLSSSSSPPRTPPWWLDGSLNGHSIPIREHSGSSLGCRVLNGGGNGYIRRLWRALHRR